jgi:hypothetical protein
MDHSRQRREKQIEYVATLATSGFGTILKWRDVRIMWALEGEADMVQTWNYVANDRKQRSPTRAT